MVLLAWVWAGSAQGDQVYRWVEKNGSVHFSDSYYDVPLEYQQQVSRSEDFGDRLSIIEGLNERFGPSHDPALGDPTSDPANSQNSARAVPDLSDISKLGFSDLSDLSKLSLGAGAIVGLVLLVPILMFAFLAVTSVILITACNMVDQEPPSLWRGMWICFACSAVPNVAQALLMWGVDISRFGIAGLVGLLALAVGLNVLVLRGLLCKTLGKAVAVLLAQLLIAFLIGAVLLGVTLLGSCVLAV